MLGLELSSDMTRAYRSDLSAAEAHFLTTSACASQVSLNPGINRRNVLDTCPSTKCATSDGGVASSPPHGHIITGAFTRGSTCVMNTS